MASTRKLLELSVSRSQDMFIEKLDPGAPFPFQVSKRVSDTPLIVWRDYLLLFGIGFSVVLFCIGYFIW